MYKTNAIPFDHCKAASCEVPSSSLASVVTELNLTYSNMSVDSVADELVRKPLRRPLAAFPYIFECTRIPAQEQVFIDNPVPLSISGFGSQKGALLPFRLIHATHTDSAW